MQLKKTHDALTVAERYPNDYNGIAANVPIVGFSSLMLAPALIRIYEKPQANWVTAAKINAIRGEFMRQCDKLDGLVGWHHQQLHDLPRNLRRDTRQTQPSSMGCKALPR
jgi:hypothetical protein